MLETKDHGKAVDWYLLGVLLYEMLVGVTPHYAKSPNEIFEKITANSVKIPSKLSEEAKSLLSQVVFFDKALTT
jgi:serine/threonine protein kinase